MDKQLPIKVTVVTHDEMLACFRKELARRGITWTQLRDSMQPCGCCSDLDDAGHHKDCADLWWLYGLREYPELADSPNPTP